MTTFSRFALDCLMASVLAAALLAVLVMQGCGTEVRDQGPIVGRTAEQPAEEPQEDKPPAGCEWHEEKLSGSSGTCRVLKCAKP